MDYDDDMEDDDLEEEEMDTDEVANFANDKVDALISLLIDKKLITEDEFDKAYEDLFEEAED